MKKFMIRDGNVTFDFVCAFSHGQLCSHENWAPPYKLQEWLVRERPSSFEQIIQWHIGNGVPVWGLEGSKDDVAFGDEWTYYRGAKRGNYFRYRYISESYLSGIQLLKHVQGGVLADVGCGVGHFAKYYKERCNKSIAIDAEWCNLYFMHKYFSPSSSLVCTDLDVTLGLEQNVVDHFFISDSFHYVKEKRRFLENVRSAWSGEGLILFNHVHHIDQQMHENGIGIPLSVECYRNMIKEVFPECKVEIYGERSFVRYALDVADTIYEANNDEMSPLTICVHRGNNLDIRKQVRLPDRMRLNNAYKLVWLHDKPVFQRICLPEAFMEEFHSDLFPDSIDFTDKDKMDTLFSFGILICD